MADVAFRGRGYEHAIDIAGHGRLTGVFAPVRADRGETVGLALDPAGCYVFAAGAQTSTEPADAPDTAPLGPSTVPLQTSPGPIL